MRIHYLQHVEFENLAHIEVWAKNKGHRLSGTALYDMDFRLPRIDTFDWLIIMGGPMNIYEYDKYPWLKEEKMFIKNAISNDKLVVGICLGAQLIADVLGAEIYKNKFKEIGWHTVTLAPDGCKLPLCQCLPQSFPAFHWHGDTFGLPDGAYRIVESEGCANQAFQYDKWVFGLQFHLESCEESINQLIRHCRSELIPDTYIQTEDEILAGNHNIPVVNTILEKFLNKLEEEYKKSL